MSRWKASLIHLGISAMIALAVLTLMLLVWYPYPLFAAVGGQQVLMILLAVDVTLGPLITLTVFNTKKSRKELTIDLSTIAFLQIAALIYGMSVIFQARPAFVVYSINSFDLVTANMLKDEDLAKAKYPDYRSLPLTGPIYVYTEMPTDIQERNEVTLSTFSGKDLPQFPKYYQPFAERMKDVAATARYLTELKLFKPDLTARIDAAVRDLGRKEAELAYIPLRAKHQDMTVLVEKSSGKILTILEISPY